MSAALIVCLAFASLPVAVAEDDCVGERCDNVDETFLLQDRRLKGHAAMRAVAAAAANSTLPLGTCNPCMIRETIAGKSKELQLDIYTPGGIDAPVPVVITYHGRSGTTKQMEPHCRNAFVKVGGFVCVAMDPLSDDSEPTFYTDKAIQFILDNAQEYNMDVDNIFLYGYSQGGISQLTYMTDFDGGASNRGKVKGFISDASAPGDKRFNWQAKVNGEYIKYPPYLMMHCWADPTMQPKYTAKKSMANMDAANLKRGADEQISYHLLKFTADTGCTHKPLLLKADAGKAGAIGFINNIAASSIAFTAAADRKSVV